MTVGKRKELLKVDGITEDMYKDRRPQVIRDAFVLTIPLGNPP